MDIQVSYLLPKTGNDHVSQLTDCLTQLNVRIKQAVLPAVSNRIIKITLFIRLDESQEYRFIKTSLQEAMIQHFPESLPPYSVIAQPPAESDPIWIAMEVSYLEASDVAVTYHQYKGLPYARIDSPSLQWICCAGIASEDPSGDFSRQGNANFKLMTEILSENRMTLSDIVRQWNYIEAITGFDTRKKRYQNYQVFNGIRSAYYDRHPFKNGYPAATGIGMNGGGLILECIAVRFKNSDGDQQRPIREITSPVQHDAYSYSDSVLVGIIRQDSSSRPTPKFVRAKWIASDAGELLFVSGTAAIDGQNTIPESDIQIQTTNTIENIQKLVSTENLFKFGIKKSGFQISHFRVYIKNRPHAETVKRLFDERFPDIETIYLISDICRTNLLIEIECMLTKPYDGEPDENRK